MGVIVTDKETEPNLKEEIAAGVAFVVLLLAGLFFWIVMVAG